MSKNQTALKEGRITERDYDRMAVYKWCAYENNEDLDYNKDYRDHGLYKLMPAIVYYTAAETYPEAVAEIYQVFRHIVEEEDLREMCHEWYDGRVRAIWSGRWYWVPWGMSGGDFAYLEGRLNDELTYPGRLEVDDAYDEDV